MPATDGAAPLLGLVRVIDRRRRRHVYGAGECPAGELVGELGALSTRSQEGSLPVWLTPDGRLATESWPPRRRPSLRAVAHWVLEPRRWVDDGHGPRIRAMARRSAISLRMLAHAYPRPVAPAGEPAGYLGGGGPASLPLYGALHPVTDDQLLTTSPGEADRLGYEGTALLGHLAAVAPVTGALGLSEVDVAWAARSRGQPKATRARGGIDGPRPGQAVSREAFVVTGWALWPPEPVARVEIAVDGQPAGLARIGLPRPDVASRHEERRRPDASLCGFEFWVDPSGLPADAAEATVEAVAVRVDGKRFALPAAAVALEPARPSYQDSGRAAELRARVDELVSRSPRLPREGLRILAFTHHLGYGGSQRYFFELLKRLSADPGVECTVAAPHTGPYTAAVESLGIAVHVTSADGGADARAYEGRMLELAAWAAPQSFDLVWANSFDSYQGADLATRLGVPLLWSIHESFDVGVWWATVHGSGESRPYARRRAEGTLGRADALVFAADATRRQYERHGAPDRMHTLPYSMELGEIERYRRGFDRAAARERLGIEPDATVVLCLGMVEPRKGQALVAQAFARVAAANPDAQLVLVGDQPNPYSAGLHDYVARSEASERIRIVPLVPDPYEWHGIADVFVLASDIESSPFVVLEAMAFETPVVATGVFGVPELIEDGVSGYLCEPSDLNSLVCALERALEAGVEERRAVGRAGGRRVHERHDPARHEERMRSLMTGLAAAPRRSARGSAAERVSVLIPTLNAGEGFEQTLEALWAQEGLDGLEIVVADSESEDDSAEVARRAGARVEVVPRPEFNHGGTRNLLAGMAEGDVLLTTVQDLTLTEPTALRDLVQALRDEPRLAAISATHTAGESADLFSRWHSWLHLERPGARPHWAVDNVCAAIRRSAWEQLRFRELEFGEDLDFGLRANAAGWTTAFSAVPLAAHHHDRTADDVLARAAIHRSVLAGLVEDLDRHPAAAPGLEALLAATPRVAGQLQAALGQAAAESGELNIAAYLRRVRDSLAEDPPAAEPAGELALLGEACALDAPYDGAAGVLHGELLTALDSPWLSQWALARLGSVERPAAEVFVARFTGSILGQVLGDAMRDAPDSGSARRLRALAVGARRPIAAAAAGRSGSGR